MSPCTRRRRRNTTPRQALQRTPSRREGLAPRLAIQCPRCRRRPKANPAAASGTHELSDIFALSQTHRPPCRSSAPGRQVAQREVRPAPYRAAGLKCQPAARALRSFAPACTAIPAPIQCQRSETHAIRLLPAPAGRNVPDHSTVRRAIPNPLPMADAPPRSCFGVCNGPAAVPGQGEEECG